MLILWLAYIHMGGSRGGGDRGSGPPLKNHENIGFLSNNGPEPLRNQAIIQCRIIISPTAKHHLNGVWLVGAMMALF